nr:hypothetical protein [Agrobacterium tumefaciens]
MSARQRAMICTTLQRPVYIVPRQCYVPTHRVPLQRLLHDQRQTGEAFTHICMAHREPDLSTSRNGDHRNLREKCLNAHWFLTLADSREKLEDWRRDLYEAVFVNPFSSFPKFLSFRYSQSSGDLAPWCLDLYAAGAIAPDHNPDSWWPGVCLKRVTKLQLGV